ncbi:MAG: phosphatidate cytidylyltransferase [Ginsengibacter sp.]
MAFDSQTFKTRTGTAVIFVIVMLAGLLWNAFSFLFLFTIIHFGCWYEFVRLIKKIRPFSWIYFLPFGLLYITLPILLLLLCGFPYFELLLFQQGYENAWNYSPVLPCGIIFSIWINDTMAYIVGSLIGKTPMSKISPKKTWEGTIGGAILCVLTISLIGMALGYYTTADWIIIAACCAVFGTLGDLLESKLKRMAKVKDSGSFMPGHGGFLDRFDSLLIASIAVGIYYIFFM